MKVKVYLYWNVPKDGAAFSAGIKKGDVITKINGVPVVSGAEMVGQIATYRPGDKVNISYKREGKEFNTNVIKEQHRNSRCG